METQSASFNPETCICAIKYANPISSANRRQIFPKKKKDAINTSSFWSGHRGWKLKQKHLHNNNLLENKNQATLQQRFHPDKMGFHARHPIGPFLLYGSIWTRTGLSLIMSSGWMSQSLGERNAWCLRERKKQSPEKVPFGARSKFTRLNSIYKHATQGVEASSLITQRHVIMLSASVKRLSNKRGVFTYC